MATGASWSLRCRSPAGRASLRGMAPTVSRADILRWGLLVASALPFFAQVIAGARPPVPFVTERGPPGWIFVPLVLPLTVWVAFLARQRGVPLARWVVGLATATFVAGFVLPWVVEGVQAAMTALFGKGDLGGYVFGLYGGMAMGLLAVWGVALLACGGHWRITWIEAGPVSLLLAVLVCAPVLLLVTVHESSNVEIAWYQALGLEVFGMWSVSCAVAVGTLLEAATPSARAARRARSRGRRDLGGATA